MLRVRVHTESQELCNILGTKLPGSGRNAAKFLLAFSSKSITFVRIFEQMSSPGFAA